VRPRPSQAHAKINGKLKNLTHCKIVTHENFNLKLGPRDYVADIPHRATLGSNWPSGGFPPNRGNITLLWLFCYTVFSRFCPQVKQSHWFLHWTAQMTCFRPSTVLLGVRTMGDVLWRKYSPKSPQKGAWIGSFKPKRQNLYIAISPELLIRRTSDLRSEFRPRKVPRGWSAITPNQIQHGWWPPSWKSIWRHISAADVPIWTKFSSQKQNNMPITAKWSRSKPEVEFQYGGRLYFKTGSSYISAANGDISTIFGLLIDFDLPLEVGPWTPARGSSGVL